MHALYLDLVSRIFPLAFLLFAASASVVGIDLLCPADGNLQNSTALEAMLRARASPRRDLIIFVLGHTNGPSQIAMRDAGVSYIQAQVAALRRHGISNYLVLSPSLGARRRGGSENLCLNFLRAKNVCCAWSSVGFDELARAQAQWSPDSTRLVSKDSPHPWGIFPTHPYLLFLQRWWLSSEALARGYNILSLDADLHLSSNPIDL